MATTTYDRGSYDRAAQERRTARARTRDVPPDEVLRLRKQRTGKGIGLFTGSLLFFMLVVVPLAFWMGSHVAPEPEYSEGFAHEALDRPATAIDDPRTIGDGADGE